MDTPALPGAPVHLPPTARAPSAWTRPTLFRLVECGVLRHPVRDVYVPSTIPDSIEVRCQALGLVLPDDCVHLRPELRPGSTRATVRSAPNEHLDVPPISCFRPSDCGRLRNKLGRQR